MISIEEMNKLFKDGFKTLRDRALFGICRYTACRINEACQLKTADVFLVSGAVRKEITFRAETTKGKYGSKTVKVSGELRQLLEDYGHPGKDYLFPGRHGLGHINPVSASNLFKAIVDELGLEHVSTHSFRRTAINRMREAGVKLEVIQTVSGHKSLDGLSHYLEVTEADKVEAIAALEQSKPPAPTATAQAEPATRSRRSAHKKPAASAPKSKQEFKTGQLVKNPAGWRGWITRLLDGGKAVVDWEGQINGDVIPLRMLKACE